jgi:hypothetical protein
MGNDPIERVAMPVAWSPSPASSEARCPAAAVSLQSSA